jgi:hypothetical protein
MCSKHKPLGPVGRVNNDGLIFVALAGRERLVKLDRAPDLGAGRVQVRRAALDI